MSGARQGGVQQRKRLESLVAVEGGGQTLLARGVRSYHRPTRIEEAQELAAQGAAPLAGGTRLLATDASVPNVLDLVGLELTGLRVEDEDVEIVSPARVLGAVTAGGRR